MAMKPVWPEAHTAPKTQSCISKAPLSPHDRHVVQASSLPLLWFLTSPSLFQFVLFFFSLLPPCYIFPLVQNVFIHPQYRPGFGIRIHNRTVLFNFSFNNESQIPKAPFTTQYFAKGIHIFCSFCRLHHKSCTSVITQCFSSIDLKKFKEEKKERVSSTCNRRINKAVRHKEMTSHHRWYFEGRKEQSCSLTTPVLPHSDKQLRSLLLPWDSWAIPAEKPPISTQGSSIMARAMRNEVTSSPFHFQGTQCLLAQCSLIHWKLKVWWNTDWARSCCGHDAAFVPFCSSCLLKKITDQQLKQPSSACAVGTVYS